MRVTASRTALLTRCQHWARDGVALVDDSSDAADDGTTFHRWCEVYAATGAEPSIDDDRMATMWSHAKAYIDAHKTETWEVERAFWWHPVEGTAAELVGTEHRDYSGAPKGSIAGTADIVDFGDELTVYDWTLGRTSKGAQLLTLALMIAQAHGYTRARIVALHVSEGGIHEVEQHIERRALDDHGAAVRAALDAVPSAAPHPGGHCAELYCPARAHCPATSAAVAQVIEPAQLVRHKLSTEIASPEHAAWMLHTLDLVDSASSQIRDKIKAYARERGGLPLPDGKVWTEVPATRQSIDGKAALALAERCGAHVGDLGACMKTTQYKTFKAVKAKGGQAA